MARLPSKPFLIVSLKKWERRLKGRREKHDFYHDDSKRPDAERQKLATKWHKNVDEAEYWVSRRRTELARYDTKPRIVTAKQAGLRFVNRWGGKGKIYRGAWHYTAGPRARGASDLLRLARQYHAYHQSKGWPGLSYEALIADDGTILFANPISIKSAGVASNNSGLVNICCPGTTGDRLTAAQKRSVAWLRDNWHTSKAPSAHRLPRRARDLGWRPHNEYPGQSTACPGLYAAGFKEAWRA